MKTVDGEMEGRREEGGWMDVGIDGCGDGWMDGRRLEKESVLGARLAYTSLGII